MGSEVTDECKVRTVIFATDGRDPVKQSVQVVTTSPTPTVTNSPTPTVTTSPTPTVTISPTPTVSISPTPTVTISPTPTENTTAVMTAVTTKPTAQSCSSIDCGENAICRPLHSGPKCECAFNFYRENGTYGTCVTGKTYGGEVKLKEEFQEEMKDVTSKIYQDLLHRVTEVFKKSLKKFGYKSTIIYDVRKGSVIIDVTNTFEQNSSVSESDIENAIPKDFTYSTVQGCNLDNCDDKTTVGCAQPQYGLSKCICKEEFYKTSRKDTKCIETCELMCKGKNQHCVPRNGILVCECQPGYKDNNGICERCPFGYNGINCEDGYQAAIVATGVVCGVVILILAIVLITLCVRLKRSEPDEQEQPILGSMSRGSLDRSEFPSKIPRVNLGGPTNRGSLNYLQSDPNQYDYSRPSPWNELSELHQKDSNPNRKYVYHN
ncbi:mucin-13-like [Mobula hypostoma]|uniref:mucin-13-like n=1 Tax=Mobula hypostoma TaxID=723540 RepID=UPI002FC3D340